MKNFGSTRTQLLKTRSGLKRLMLSPVWVLSFIFITAMDCSGPGEAIRIDQAGYNENIRLAADANGHVLIGYEQETRNDVVVYSNDGTDFPAGSSSQLQSRSLNSYTYDFALGESSNFSTIVRFDVSTTFVTDFELDMGPSGIAVSSWRRNDTDNNAQFYGSGYNINQTELTWLPSTTLTGADGVAFSRSFGLSMGQGNLAVFAGETIDSEVYTRYFDGSSSTWAIDISEPDIGISNPQDFHFDFYGPVSLSWVQDGALTPELYSNQFVIGTPLNETVQQLAASATGTMRILDTAIARSFSDHEIVVWSDGSSLSSIYYDGQSWSSYALAISDPKVFKGNVVIDNTGSALFVWVPGNSSGQVKIKHFTPGVGWGIEQILGQGENPKISMNLQGMAVVIWSDGSDLHSARYSPQSAWQADGIISTNLAFADEHEVIIDNLGNALAAWSTRVNPQGGVVYGTRIRLHDYTRASLDVTVNGNGRVQSTPAGIDCGSDCSQQYNLGSSITLTAIPDSGATFIGWNGDCTEIIAISNQASITLNSNASCTANFAEFTLSTFNLTLTITGGPGAGEVSSSETPIPLLNCINSNEATTTCVTSYSRGSNVFLSPSAYGTATGVSWAGCDSDFGIEGCSLTMNSDRNVTVSFQ